MNRSTTDQLAATVLITTKDRRVDLERAIESVMSQTVPVELLVVDDGSSDGTSAMVRERYPQARLLRNEKPLGIIAARNRAAHEANTDILFTLDDDAAYSDANVIRYALQDMEHPRVGAVAIPLVNHIAGERQPVDQFLEAPGRQAEDFLCTFSYRGGANALRRGLFLQLGGYDGTGRQGEEHTYCARLLSAGYVVRVATRGHVDHYPETVWRDLGQLVEYRAQNGIEFAWKYIPFPHLLIFFPTSCWRSVKRSIRRRHIWRGMRGLKNGWLGILFGKYRRAPMSRPSYRLMRKLIKNYTMPLSSLEPLLPTLTPLDSSESQYNQTTEKHPA